MGRTAIWVAVVALLAGCGGTASGSDLHPAWVEMVDARAGDCAGLQEAFDNADEGETDTGVKVDKLEYVDAALRRSGCYD